jgi:hypothetical protein
MLLNENDSFQHVYFLTIKHFPVISEYAAHILGLLLHTKVKRYCNISSLSIKTADNIIMGL